MNLFKEQIKEDIKIIQDNIRRNNPKIEKEEYAFNYWVLSKLYNMEEELIEDNITEYSDYGIDCFVYFEESKDLYIVQNKYYSEDTKLTKDYVQNDFLVRPMNMLLMNSYVRSQELQDIFNKYKEDSEFKIHLYLYVSNDLRDDSIIRLFEQYQAPVDKIKCYVDAKIFYLSDIKNVYFEDRKKETKNFKCDFLTINDGTVLQINKENYGLPNLIEAKYVFTPVKVIYDIVKSSKEKGYSLFAENIREYLGNKGINAQIAKTLEDENERANFFYYNNGITVICDKIDKEQSNNIRYNRRFVTYNPQIVNGCQSVNSIYTVLNKYNQNELENKFKDTFVMVKLLVLDAENSEQSKLYQDIVRYNNSQNAITEKAFAANQQLFFNMQVEFEKRGFLLAVKQSDVYKFKANRRFNDYRPLLEKYEELFDLKFEKIENIIIPLEKLLQIFLAFDQNGYQAFVKKSQVLKQDSVTNTTIIKFIKEKEYTINDLLNIYLLYLKAEKDKKNSEDQRTPIPFYLIGFLGSKFQYKSSKRCIEVLRHIFNNKTTLNAVYNLYMLITKLYKSQFASIKGIDYNKMIKSPIDDNIFIQAYNTAKDIITKEQRDIINEIEKLLNEN